MATIMDLLKTNKKELYGGTSGELYIDSQGLVNVPRAAALVASSPSAVADLIGNQVGGILKASANRVSDTIFKNNKPFTKPVTFLVNAQNAIDTNTPYYIKRNPSPASIFAKLKQGATSPIGLVTRTAINVAKNPLKAANAIKSIGKSLKGTATAGDSVNAYGAELSQTPDGLILNANHKFSEFAPVYTWVPGEGYRQTGTEKREKLTTFDTLINSILTNQLDSDGKNFRIERDNMHNVPYVLFALYPDRTKKILLPATISGLSEDMSPDIASFKYLGSPFSSYKYNGVERSIKFNLKLYFTNEYTKKIMIGNLNKLRKLVYPTDKLTNVTYEGSTEYVITSFSPNLVYLTISGLYKELFGIIDSLSFSIDDNVPWVTTDNQNESAFNGKSKVQPHPSVIDVSISMKVMETPRVWEDGDKNTVWEYADDTIANTYFTSNVEIDRNNNEQNSYASKAERARVDAANKSEIEKLEAEFNAPLQ